MHASHYSPANIDAVKNAAAKAFGNIDQDIVLVTDLDLVGLAVGRLRGRPCAVETLRGRPRAVTKTLRGRPWAGSGAGRVP